MVDVLPRRYALLLVPKCQVLRFIPSKLCTKRIKTSRKWWRIPLPLTLSLYRMVSSSKETRFASPISPRSDLIIKKALGEALASHFGVNETVEILNEHFYWPKMGEDVHKVITRCSICHMAKNYFHQGLYTSFPVHTRLWPSQGHQGEGTLSWWWWIDSLRWLTSLLAKVMMLPILRTFSFKKL